VTKKNWIWPLGIAVAGVGSAAAILLRGCWHNRMSWPIKDEESHEFSYQVCTGCGVKRLFDERSFEAYGPYSYDLHKLIARERLWRKNHAHLAPAQQSETSEVLTEK
jgi:hypothetical protein